MFYAHNGVALAASPSDRNAPIVAYMVASWAPDLTGIGHWLPFTVVLSAVAYVLGKRWWSGRAGIVLASLVWSHLLLDLVVGLQIMPGGRFIGLNLSGHSVEELTLELVAVVIGFVCYAAGRRRLTPLIVVAFVLTVGFTFAVWSFADDPSDHNPPVAKLGVGVAGLLVTSWLLIVSDRSRSTDAESSA